jgi:hypothetical protein
MYSPIQQTSIFNVPTVKHDCRTFCPQKCRLLTLFSEILLSVSNFSAFRIFSNSFIFFVPPKMSAPNMDEQYVRAIESIKADPNIDAQEMERVSGLLVSLNVSRSQFTFNFHSLLGNPQESQSYGGNGN